MSWMAWTPETAIFFLSIFLSLVTMTVLELKRPTVPRRGFLRIVTSRGDRFFISLLAAAYIHLGWLGLTAMPLVLASVIAIAAAVFIMRWG